MKTRIKFTSSCLIHKNTPELCQKLKELGYDILFSARNGCTDCLYASLGCVTTCGQQSISMDNPNITDCADNEELFLALAALRDDSDIQQWFTDGEGNWRFSYHHGWAMSECIANDYDTPVWLDQDKWHKATVKELIEHFGKPQNPNDCKHYCVGRYNCWINWPLRCVLETHSSYTCPKFVKKEKD